VVRPGLRFRVRLEKVRMKKPMIYEIWIAEQLDHQWAEWFTPLVIQHEANGMTTLSGPVRDQGELHGILAKVRDLNLTLLSVQQREVAQKSAAACEEADDATESWP
jgi:hypothetical protein